MLYIVAVPAVAIFLLGGDFFGPKGDRIGEISGYGLMALAIMLLSAFFLDRRAAEVGKVGKVAPSTARHVNTGITNSRGKDLVAEFLLGLVIWAIIGAAVMFFVILGQGVDESVRTFFG